MDSRFSEDVFSPLILTRRKAKLTFYKSLLHPEDHPSHGLLYTSHLPDNLLKKESESCFMDEKTEAQRSGVTCPGSQFWDSNPSPSLWLQDSHSFLCLRDPSFPHHLPAMLGRKPWPLLVCIPPSRWPGLSSAQTRMSPGDLRQPCSSPGPEREEYLLTNPSWNCNEVREVPRIQS